MKNLKSNFGLSLFLAGGFLLHSCATGKINYVSDPLLTIQYSENEKTHSRAIVATEKELIIAGSDGTVYFYPKETKSIYSLFANPEKEYRDLIFEKNKVLILAVGDSSEVTSYKLEKSNKIFKTPFSNLFLNGFDAYNNMIFMMGDPVNNKFSLFTSSDWGESWQAIKNSPFAFDGEAGYAASGTNLKMLDESILTFVSGGDSSRFFLSSDAGETWYSKTMGFNSCATCGAYSFTVLRKGRIIAVGGNYLKPDDTSGTCRISVDDGQTWFSPKSNPNGFRSNITEINKVLYASGTNGIDFSIDRGENWNSFAKGNYFTLCEFDGNLAASTTNGRIHLFKLVK